MHRVGLLVVALICAALGQASCSRAPDDGASVLRRGNGGEPATLDPTLAEDVHAFAVLADLYEGLVVPGPAGEVLPGVAEVWSIHDDGRRYEFVLRENARWSDGRRVAAEDFVRRFHEVAAPGSRSTLSFLLSPLRNFADVSAGRLPLESLGVEAVNESTLRLSLDGPAPHFLSVLTMPIAYPLHPMARRGKDSAIDTPSNGAYRLEDWLPGEKITVSRNPEYWARDSVMIEQVAFYPIAEPNAELNLYRAGNLDITHTVPPARVAELENRRGSELRIAEKLALYYIALDITEPPLDDSNLRAALSLAIDRDAIVRMLGRGEQAAFGLVPDGIPGYEPSRYDWQGSAAPDREHLARERLRMVATDASNLRPIRLIYDDGDVHERVALAVSDMWQRTLGVAVALEKREWKQFLDTRGRRDEWDAMRFSWFGDFNDPTTFTNLFLSGNEQNLPGFASDQYDSLLDRAALLDGPERARLIAAAERHLLNEYPVIPLYFYVSKHLVSPRVLGFEDNALDRHLSRYLSFKDQQL